MEMAEITFACCEQPTFTFGLSPLVAKISLFRLASPPTSSAV